jgi:SAM-dependent methyltransferase
MTTSSQVQRSELLGPASSSLADLTNPQGKFGVFTSRPDRLDADIKGAGALSGQLTQNEVRCLAQSNATHCFPYGREQVGCAYVPFISGSFDNVLLGRSLRLFRNAWGAAFMAQAARSITPGGRLMVPFVPESNSQGFWRLSDLVSFFEVEPIEIGSGHASFLLKRAPSRPLSILNWFYDEFADLIIYEMQQRFAACDFTVLNGPVLSKFLRNASEENWAAGEYAGRARSLAERLALPDQAGLALPNQAEKISEQRSLGEVIREHSYFIGGISYKSALMAEIIRAHCAKRSGLRYCDLGGGYGLLAAELLLAEADLVEFAINVDYSGLNLLLGAKMYINNALPLAERFQFWLGNIMDFEFHESFDVVSLIGSLLYVPKQQRHQVIERAWKALEPGGVLVVHENIRAPSYIRDFDKMFTVEEIDTLLGKFGPIERYLSTAIARVDREEAADRSVFRVLTKA